MRIALFLQRVGLSSDLLHSLGFASVAGSLAVWARSGRNKNDAARARAERGAIFVGLWPPTLILLGKVLQDLERAAPNERARAEREAQPAEREESLRAA
jgi:hypothetical protein